MKVLNSRLSEYVRLAASGETVLVTNRGRVMAEIGPPKVTRSPILADAGKPPTPEPVAPLQDLLGELDDDRSERCMTLG